MKKKIITLGSILFMCLAFVTVGFAAWVISGNAKGDANGSVQADTVVDKSYSMTALTSNDNKIIFGAPIESSEGWLTNDGTLKEKLTVTFTATVSQGGTPVDFTKDQTLDATLQSDTTKVTAVVTATDQKYQDAVKANLITSPTVTISGDSDGKITVTITVAWGTTFGSQNPYTYYNGLPQAEKQAEAIQNLKTLEALSNVNYQLTVNVTSAR